MNPIFTSEIGQVNVNFMDTMHDRISTLRGQQGDPVPQGCYQQNYSGDKANDSGVLGPGPAQDVQDLIQTGNTSFKMNGMLF